MGLEWDSSRDKSPLGLIQSLCVETLCADYYKCALSYKSIHELMMIGQFAWAYMTISYAVLSSIFELWGELIIRQKNNEKAMMSESLISG